MARNGTWLDEDPGSVRPFVLVRGRVDATQKLDRASLVQASVEPPATPLPEHYAEAFALCRSGPCSVAEIAARLRRPLQVVKIWLSDLLDSRHLVVPMPKGLATTAATDPELLEAVLVGLRRL